MTVLLVGEATEGMPTEAGWLFRHLLRVLLTVAVGRDVTASVVLTELSYHSWTPLLFRISTPASSLSTKTASHSVFLLLSNDRVATKASGDL